jgi:hypothetical protein
MGCLSGTTAQSGAHPYSHRRYLLREVDELTLALSILANGVIGHQVMDLIYCGGDSVQWKERLKAGVPGTHGPALASSTLAAVDKLLHKYKVADGEALRDPKAQTRAVVDRKPHGVKSVTVSSPNKAQAIVNPAFEIPPQTAATTTPPAALLASDEPDQPTGASPTLDTTESPEVDIAALTKGRGTAVQSATPPKAKSRPDATVGMGIKKAEDGNYCSVVDQMRIKADKGTAKTATNPSPSPVRPALPSQSSKPQQPTPKKRVPPNAAQGIGGFLLLGGDDDESDL